MDYTNWTSGYTEILIKWDFRFTCIIFKIGGLIVIPSVHFSDMHQNWYLWEEWIQKSYVFAFWIYLEIHIYQPQICKSTLLLGKGGRLPSITWEVKVLTPFSMCASRKHKFYWNKNFCRQQLKKVLPPKIIVFSVKLFLIHLNNYSLFFSIII